MGTGSTSKPPIQATPLLLTKCINQKLPVPNSLKKYKKRKNETKNMEAERIVNKPIDLSAF